MLLSVHLLTHTKGTPEGLNYSAKGKAIADTPSKTKTPYLKKIKKPLVSGSITRQKYKNQDLLRKFAE